MFTCKFLLAKRVFLWENFIIIEIFLLLKIFYNHVKICWSWKTSMAMRNFLNFGKVIWFWKVSLIMEDFFYCWRLPSLQKTSLIVESFLDSRKLSWSRKKLSLLKTTLIKEKSLLFKDFFCQVIIFDYGKLL